MRARTRVLAPLALTSALALAAGPALANGGGSFVDMPPWQWNIATGGGEWGVSETTYTGLDGPVYLDAWAQSSMAFTRPSPPQPSTDASSLQAAGAAPTFPFACTSVTVTTSGSDSIVSCDDTVTMPWGLSITSEVRILAPGDLARVTFFVTNTADNATPLGYVYQWAYGTSAEHVQSSAPTVAHNTLAGGGLLGASDVWSYNVGARTLNSGVAWGIQGSRFVANFPFHRGFTNASVVLSLDAAPTLGAGETIALAFFHIVETPPVFIDNPDSSQESQAPAEAPVGSAEAPQPAAIGEPTRSPAIMAEFATFDGRLTRGLPSDVQVGNWQPAAIPELANTGADSDVDGYLLVGGFAAVLLGAGGALVLRRATRAFRR